MPVLPLVGSRIVAPGLSTPPRPAWAAGSSAPSASDRPARAPTSRSSTRSYVIHRPHGAAARQRAGGQIAEGELIDHLRDRARDLVPELGQVVALARATAAAALRLEGRAGSLHRSQDVSHRDVLRLPGELIAAR